MLFPKRSCSEELPLLKRYFIEKVFALKNRCSADVPALNKQLVCKYLYSKQVPSPKISQSDKATALKNNLFSKSGCSVAKSLSKSSYSEKNNYYKEANNPKKELFKTSSCSEETAAPKSNCYVEVVTVKKYEEVASPKKNCLEKCIYKRNVARREIAI